MVFAFASVTPPDAAFGLGLAFVFARPLAAAVGPAKKGEEVTGLDMILFTWDF